MLACSTVLLDKIRQPSWTTSTSTSLLGEFLLCFSPNKRNHVPVFLRVITAILDTVRRFSFETLSSGLNNNLRGQVFYALVTQDIAFFDAVPTCESFCCSLGVC